MRLRFVSNKTHRVVPVQRRHPSGLTPSREGEATNGGCDHARTTFLFKAPPLRRPSQDNNAQSLTFS